jgi:hypothetical protein
LPSSSISVAATVAAGSRTLTLTHKVLLVGLRL